MKMLSPRPRAVTSAIFADASDPKVVLAQLNTAFEEYKKVHNEALKAKADDAVVTAKLDKLNAAIDNAQAEMDRISARLAAGSEPKAQDPHADPEYSKLWADFFRHGDGDTVIRAQQKSGPRAAMAVGSNPDGGYFAPVEWDRTVTSKLKEISPIRQNARVQSISGPGVRKVYNDRAIVSGWVGETAARPQTAGPQLGILDFNAGELYAFPFASQTLLEDSEVNIETWLAGEVNIEFSRQENIAFLAGDGANKPFGILTYVTGGDNAAKHPWGAIQASNSGAAAAFTSDGFIDLFYSLPAAFRAGAKLYVNRLSQAAMRKLKDGQNNYLWQPSYAAGQPATLAGEAIVEVPDMPGVAAGNIAALYGDMEATYLVIDRVGISMLRDSLTNKPFIGFYTRKRVGGGVYNPEPMRALKIGTGA